MKFELLNPENVDHASIEKYSISHNTSQYCNKIVSTWWWLTFKLKNKIESKHFLTWQEAIIFFDKLYQCSSDWEVKGLDKSRGD